MDKIGIISDIHYGEKFEDIVKKNLISVLDEFELNCDLVIFLGDHINNITELDSSDSKDLENIKDFYSLIKNYSFEKTFLLGNHDTLYLDRNYLSELFNQDVFYGSKEISDNKLIYLDTSYKKVSGYVSDDQVEYINNLKRKKDLIVFSHHPLTNFHLSGNYWFKNLPVYSSTLNSETVTELIENSLFISGHIHQEGNKYLKSNYFKSLEPFNKLDFDYYNYYNGAYYILDLESKKIKKKYSKIKY